MRLKSFFFSLRFRLILLVLLAIIPAAGLILYTSAQQREVVVEAARAEMLHLAESVSAQQNLLAESTHQLLVGLARLPEVNGEDTAACSASLASLISENSLYANIIIVKPNGDLWCSALPPRNTINYADRAWLPMALRTRGFVAGGYVIGKITRRSMATFAYPLLDATGQAKAVIAVGLDLAWLNRYLEQTPLPQDTVLTVLDEQGTVLARTLESDKWVGQSAPEVEVVRTVLAQNNQGTVEAMGLDGVHRLYGFAPLTGGGYVLVGTPTTLVYAKANQVLFNDLVAFGAVTLLALALAWLGSDVFLLRQINVLMDATRRMAVGDFSVRTGVKSGVGELDRLAHAFDEMAENLETRERQRQQFEDALQASEARLKEAQSLAHLGSWELDLVHNVLSWSDQVFRIFEIDPQQFDTSYQAFLNIVHPEDRAKVDEAYRRSVEEHTPYTIEHRLLFSDGRVKYVSERGQTFYDDTGHPLRSIGTVQDITEQKRGEEQLRLQSTALESAADAIAITDRDGVIQWVNHAFTTSSGYTPAECIGKTMRLVKSGLHDQKVYSQLWETILAGQIWRNKMVNRRKDGTLYTVEQVITPVRGAGGEITRFVTVQRDISERQRHERKVEAEALVAQALQAGLALQPLLERLVAAAVHAVPVAEKGSILLVGTDGRLRIRALYGYSDPRVWEVAFPSDSGYAARCAREGLPLLLDDVRVDSEIRYDGDIEEMVMVKSAIAAPLLVGAQVIGVITLDNTTRTSAFAKDDLHTLSTIASTAALVIENARLFEETHRRLKQVQALRHIDMAITASLDPRVTLNVLLDEVTMQLSVDAAAVLLLDSHTLDLTYSAGRGFRTRLIEHTHLHVGECYAGRTVLERRILALDDLPQVEDPLRQRLFREEGFQAYYAAPMISKGNVLGVLETFHRQPMNNNREWVEMLEALAGQAAIAVDNARLFDELERSNLNLRQAYDATIEGWSRALDLRDHETEGHTQRVTEMTLQLARAAGMSEKELVHVRRGALLHDIGKMGIPDAILLKPDKLTEEEWAIMRKHPTLAYEMLSPIPYLHPALDIPYCHHEKWDGSGYPRGLKGEQIPLAARLFAVVDVWDALRSNRHYRPGWTEEQAREYIRAQSGSHFDPQVVELFFQVLDVS